MYWGQKYVHKKGGASGNIQEVVKLRWIGCKSGGLVLSFPSATKIKTGWWFLKTPWKSD